MPQILALQVLLLFLYWLCIWCPLRRSTFNWTRPQAPNLTGPVLSKGLDCAGSNTNCSPSAILQSCIGGTYCHWNECPTAASKASGQQRGHYRRRSFIQVPGILPALRSYQKCKNGLLRVLNCSDQTRPQLIVIPLTLEAEFPSVSPQNRENWEWDFLW